MKVKKLLRFFCSAEELNGLLDGLIVHVALQSGADVFSHGERYAERLICLAEEKRALSDLWARLNAVMEGLTEADRITLTEYTRARVTPKDEKEAREVHRAVVKFSRRAHGILCGGGDGLRLVNKYYALMFPPSR